MTSIIGGTDLPDPQSIRLRENVELFKQLLNSLGGKFEAVCNGLVKLVVVDIALTRGQDNP